MRARLHLFLLLFALLCSWPVAAQTSMRIPLVDLTGIANSHDVVVPAGVRELVIDRVELGSRPQGTQLTIRRPPTPMASFFDRRATETLDVRVNAITMLSGPAPNLVLSLEDVEVGVLEIVREAVDSHGAGPVVDIEMKDASVWRVNLRGGTYGRVTILVGNPYTGPRLDGLDSGANIQITGAALKSLTVRQHDIVMPPVAITAVLSLTPSIRTGTGPMISIENVNLLNADLTLKGGPQPALGQRSADCGDRLRLAVTNVEIGGSTDSPAERGRAGELQVVLPPNLCFALSMETVRANGRIGVQGGLLEELALSSISTRRGDEGVELEVTAMHRVKMVDLDVSALRIVTTGEDERRQQELLSWSNVDVAGPVQLPRSLFQELYRALRSSPNDPAQLNVREFLVDTRWRGYISGSDSQKVTKDSLFAVLQSDAQRIHGTAFSGFLLVTTGFGIHLWWPIGVMVILLAGPAVLLAILSRSGKSVPATPDYYQALATGRFANAPPAPGWQYVVSVHRILIVIELGLFTLFIQNAVLVGN